MNTKVFRQALAMTMAMLLSVTNVNFSLIANATDYNAQRIIGFKNLDETVSNQELLVGASLEDVKLPGKLEATVETLEEVQVVKPVEKEPEIGQEEKQPNDNQVVEDIKNVEEVVDTEASPEEPEKAESETEDIQDEDEAEEADATEPEEISVDEETPAEEVSPADKGSESVDVSIVDILFPPIVVQAEELEPEPAESPVAGLLESITQTMEQEYETVIERRTTQKDVTLEVIQWKTEDGRKYDFSQEGTTVFVPVIKTDYMIDAALPTVTVNIVNTNPKTAFEKSQVVDGVRILVTADAGVFPDGATLSVTKVSGAEAQAVEAAVEENRDDNKNAVEAYTFDIKVLDKAGDEVEPDTSKGQVKVSFTLDEVANANLNTDVYHVKGEVGDLSVDKLDTNEVSADTVEATTDGFSYYTVEFTYNNLQYVMNGDTTVALSDILSTVGLSGNIESAVSGNPELFTVEKQGDAWIVTAKQAFSSEESLKVKLDGVEYVIVVTDATTYNLWIGSVEVTSDKLQYSDNSSKWKYIPSTNTLELNGFHYQLQSAYQTNGHVSGSFSGYIYYGGSQPLNIKLTDTTTIKLNYGASADIGTIIYSNAGINFSGSGKLIAEGPDCNISCYSIYSGGDITIKDCTIEVKSDSTTMENGQESAAIKGKNVTITNAKVKALADVAGTYGYGIYSDGDVLINGTSDVVISADSSYGSHNADGIWSTGNVTIDGTVKAKIGDYSDNGYEWDAKYGVNLTGSGKKLSIGEDVSEIVIEGRTNAVKGKIVHSVDGQGASPATSLLSNTTEKEYTYKKLMFPYVDPANFVAMIGTNGYTTIEQALTNWTAGTTLKLTKNVTTSAPVTISETKTLDLNGHGFIRGTTGTDKTVIGINGGALTIKDSDTTVEHKYTQSNYASQAVVDDAARYSYQTFNGGYITGGGNAIVIEVGTVNIEAGTIIGNDGHGIYISSNASGSRTLNMSGGAIIGNKSSSGAALYVDQNGNATLENVVIKYNTSSASYTGNGGIYGKKGSINLKNVQIIDNYSNENLTYSNENDDYTRGVVVIKPECTLTLAGQCVITNNRDNRNVFLTDGATLSASGLTEGSNIGIKMRNPGVFTSDVSEASYFISDNTSYVVNKDSTGYLTLVAFVSLTDSTAVTIKKGDSELTEAPIVGDVLTADCIASYLTYQWYADGVAIEGATESSYTVTAADVGKKITVKVTQVAGVGGEGIPENDISITSAQTQSAVKKSGGTLTPDQALESTTIGFASEKVTSSGDFEFATTDTATEGVAELDISSIIDRDDPNERVIYVRRKANAGQEASTWQAVYLPGRPEAPVGMTTIKASSTTTADGAIIGTSATMEYKLNTANAWNAATDAETMVGAGTYSVRHKASGTTFASKTVSVVVDEKPTPPAPDTDTFNVKASTPGKADGSISGLTSSMEYSSDGGTTWETVSKESLTGLKPGTYLVRYRGDANTNPSHATKLIIEAENLNLQLGNTQATDISPTSITLTGIITPEKYATDDMVTEAGFKYRKSGENEWITVPAELRANGVFAATISGLDADTDYEFSSYIILVTGEKIEKESSTTIHSEPTEKTEKGKISVSITAESPEDTRVIIVSVERGNDSIASNNLGSLGAAELQVDFEGLADGNYNVVCSTLDGKFVDTKLLTVENGNAVATSFVVLKGNVAAVVDVKEDAPKVAVEGLGNLLTNEDKEKATGNTDVQVKLEVSNNTDENSEEVSALKDLVTPGHELEKVFDLNIFKTTTVKDELGNKTSEEKSPIVSTGDNLIQIVIPLDGLVAKGLSMLRYHANKATKLLKLLTKPTVATTEGFFVDEVTKYIFLYASNFSAYAITHEDEQPAGSSGSTDNRTEIVTVPVYRLYNTTTGDHFYTMIKQERDILLNEKAAEGWTDEGTAWQARDKNDKPVYRLFDRVGKQGHVYTTNVELRNQYIANGWTDEGIAWYSPSYAGRVVYKITDKRTGKILYTISKQECDMLKEEKYVIEEADFVAY